jgi:hypothetical protein
MNRYVNMILMFVVGIIISYFITYNSIIIDNRFDHLHKVYVSIYMALWMVFVELIVFTIVRDEYTAFVIFSMLIVLIMIIIMRYLIREQIGVGDNDYLYAMIGSAQSDLQMSEKILKKTKNVRISTLAYDTIQEQQKNIDVMKLYLKKK